MAYRYAFSNQIKTILMSALSSSRTGPRQRGIQVISERRRRHTMGSGECSHHHPAATGKSLDPVPHQVPQPALHAVAVDRRTHRLAHDETDGRGSAGSRNDMGDEGWLRAFGSTTDRVPEVIPAAHALNACEQRIRQTAWRGPCGVGQRGSRGRRGCACGGGSRASWHDDDCSAGKCACSRCCPFDVWSLTDLSLGRSTATARPRPENMLVVGMRRKSF
jgi:hypothetical protein